MRAGRFRFAVLGMLAAMVGAALGNPRAEILEEIVAKINNSIITRSRFMARLEVVKIQLSRRYVGDELDARLAAAHEATLRNMIVEELLVQRGDLLLDMDRVRQNLLADFKRQQEIETDEELEQRLKEQRLTRRDLLDTLVRLAIPQEVIKYEVRRKISVSETEIRDYYESHLLDFTTPEQVTFREIVILFEEATLEEARARSTAIRRELDAGASFEEVVARESQASSRERGGLVGPFARGELLLEIEEAVFKLAPDQLAGPIQSERAFHILKLENRMAQQVTPLSEARSGITERIRDGKFQEKLEEYLENLWNDNYVYVYPSYGTVDWKPPSAVEPDLDSVP